MNIQNKILRLSTQNKILTFILGILFLEFCTMLVLALIPPMSLLVTAVVDCIVLSILIAPSVYFFVIRPMSRFQQEKKLAEEARNQSEEKYRRIVETSYEGIVIGSPNGEILYANKRFAEMLGYESGELIGHIGTEFMFDDQKSTIEKTRTELRNGKAVLHEFRFRRKDGSLLITQFNTSPLYDKIGKYIGNLAMHTDITARRNAEEKIRLNEAQRKAIIQTAMDGFWIVDAGGYIIEVNDTYCRMSGYTEQELLKMNITDLEDNEDTNETALHMQKVIEFGEDRFESRHKCKDDSIINVEISVQYRPVGDGQFVAFIHDITNRKLAEKQLRQSEGRYKSLFENNNSVMLLIDPESGKITDSNPAASNYYGWSHAELCTKNIAEINTLSSEMVSIEMQKAKAEKRNHFYFKHRLSNNEIRDVEVYAGPITFGEHVFLYSIIHDITERIQAEKNLKESELKFRKYIDYAPHGIFVANELGEYTDVNPAACKMTGYSKSELLSMKFTDLVPEDSLTAASKHFNTIVREDFATGELNFRKKDGSIGYWVVDAVKLSNQRFLGFTTETTERKLSELILMEKEQLLTESQSAAHIGSYSTDLIRKRWKASEEIFRIFGVDETYPSTLDGWISRVHPDFRKVLSEDLQKADHTTTQFNHEYKIIRFNDGQERWVHGIGKFEFNGHSKPVGLIGTIQDITERKEREEKLRKLNETLAVLSKSRQVILHATDEADYLKQVCNIVVDDCGFAMVWIGFANEDESKSIQPIVSSGFEDGYLETLELTWSDSERGKGPTGTAIRTGKMSICRDMRTDPAFGPWRDEALKRGYASSIVFPLMTNNKAIGAIAVYSRVPDSFKEDEINLLSELAKDLSTGITASRWRTAQLKAEQALKKLIEELEDIVNERTSDLLNSHIAIQTAEEKYRTVAENTYDWETWVGPDGNYIYVSPSCKRITGRSVQEFMDDPDLFIKITHPDDREIINKHTLDTLSGSIADCTFDFRIITNDGETRWLGHNCHAVYNNLGKFIGQRGSNRDITERKNAEKVLIDSQKHLRELTHRMDVIAEEERIRIAREIHDELGHLLTALKYDMDGLSNNPDLTIAMAKSELEAMISMIDSLIDSVRKIATDLRPGILDHLGLFPALEWKIREFQKRTKICTHINLHETEITFSKNETTIIYRIVQEILTNVARHSKASKLEVMASKKDDFFVLGVTDDGVGFELKDHQQKGSLGLMGMRERALSIGGEIQIESSPGKGTTVRLLLRKD